MMNPAFDFNFAEDKSSDSGDNLEQEETAEMKTNAILQENLTMDLSAEEQKMLEEIRN